ncbi:hypothetical protein SN811_08170 [Ligilactobacillus agilis]|uniref:HTH cro/C1-type domain-containing protein n=1 Tax=Ligilactobacillus agilis TaxID=1601 RepID=A0A6F9Y4C9_9LACO|nr:helix-turn-helix domain-containing protein [Ligilactobacillus agilis]GET12317.1 hypothetical protein SN811_08170 [Ligilactobacillus agilis]
MNRIRQLRKERGLSITKLAEIIGISYQSLQRYEAGKRDPSIQVLIALADYFNVTVDYLVGREPKGKTIKSYHYYVIDDDYTLKKLGVTAPTSEIPILDENEFEALKYSLESNDKLPDSLHDLCRLYYSKLYHADEISDASFEELARILVNKEAFYVEVIERVDS